MQVKTEMKHKVGKEPGGGNKKGKEVGNESHLQLGLDETAHVEPAPVRKRNLAQPIVESDTVTEQWIQQWLQQCPNAV